MNKHKHQWRNQEKTISENQCSNPTHVRTNGNWASAPWIPDKHTIRKLANNMFSSNWHRTSEKARVKIEINVCLRVA